VGVRENGSVWVGGEAHTEMNKTLWKRVRMIYCYY
jgi:hypothetical protein